MQKDLNAYLHHSNHERTHQERGREGKTPYQAFLDSTPKKEQRRMTERTLRNSAHQGRQCQVNTISVESRCIETLLCESSGIDYLQFILPQRIYLILIFE